MLVHKQTMGIIDRVWTGDYMTDQNGVRIPIERKVILDDVDSPDDWWEVSTDSSLGKRIKKFYPFITPIVDNDGNLVDVVSINEYDEAEEQLKKIKMEEMANRGYKNRRGARPLGLMPFLNKG